MRFSKVLSAITLFLVACQSVCGIYLTQNPALTASGPNGFHVFLGITILVFALAAAISVFYAAKKIAKN
jgi:hypothetical protein